MECFPLLPAAFVFARDEATVSALAHNLYYVIDRMTVYRTSNGVPTRHAIE